MSKRLSRNWTNPLVALLVIFWPFLARAELRIEITQGVESAIPIAVVPFAQPWRGNADDLRIDQVVMADLTRSGWFDLTPPESMLDRPYQSEDVDYRDWRLLGVDAVLVGQVELVGEDKFDVRFELLDAVKKQRLAGSRFSGVAGGEMRRLGHFIADQVFRQLTGIDGIFSTRIAYVTSAAGRYQLQIADIDGFNPVEVLSSPEPILSPGWSADGKHIAYVAFDQGRPAIFRQELASGNRQKVTQFSGINGAPSWSPDGRELALTLQLVVINGGRAGWRLLKGGGIIFRP